jgi:hypothetical protein
MGMAQAGISCISPQLIYALGDTNIFLAQGIRGKTRCPRARKWKAETWRLSLRYHEDEQRGES